jgi:A/G-specific adenine glycosylase
MRRMPSLVQPVVAWYARHARDLPWRSPDAAPWAILASEVMLQQTPVTRVLPVYQAWLARWPTPSALAAEPAGEAVRMWGRLGYPRRALRLHACAVAIRDQFAGEVPKDLAELESLPGIGTYTARAVAAFAFGRRVPVVDTNVRRVVARAVGGLADGGPASTGRDLAAVEALLPETHAARFSVALMELGALVCTAKSPRCDACPLADTCAWRLAGAPTGDGRARRTQRYAGTDRQVRGLLMAVLRESPTPIAKAALDAAWHDEQQRERALDSLIVDGLIDPLPDDRYALPA